MQTKRPYIFRRSGRFPDRKRICIFLVLLGLLLCQLSCPHSPRSASTEALPAGGGAANDQRPFTLLITGNWSGHLEPCGCTEIQLGGIDRRTETMKRVAPDSQSRLLIDGGPLVPGSSRQDQLKLEVFLRSLKTLQYDAVHLSADELILLNRKLDLPPQAYPAILCSNMDSKDQKQYNVIPSLQKLLRFERHSLECIVFGLAVPPSSSGPADRNDPVFKEPASSLRTLLTQMNLSSETSNPDKLIIVLLSTDEGSLLSDLKQIPALDLLVIPGIADEADRQTDPGSSPMVITTGNLGKYINRIQLAPGSKAQVSEFVWDALPIDSRFPRDPAIVRIIEDYQQMLQLENLVADEKAILREPLPEGLFFAGNSSCALCHESIYTHWENFAHAHAINTLEREERLYDPECIVCHTVGMKYDSGYRGLEETPDLANVGCEMCHGPGSEHMEAPHMPYQIIFNQCETCHDHENSPNFLPQRKDYFQKIQHWQEPRTYWE